MQAALVAQSCRNFCRTCLPRELAAPSHCTGERRSGTEDAWRALHLQESLIKTKHLTSPKMMMNRRRSPICHRHHFDQRHRFESLRLRTSAKKGKLEAVCICDMGGTEVCPTCYLLAPGQRDKTVIGLEHGMWRPRKWFCWGPRNGFVGT